MMVKLESVKNFLVKNLITQLSNSSDYVNRKSIQIQMDM